MCGIYGELSLRLGRRPGPYGEAATDRLAHRGPDERGTWMGDRVFLGARRLSVIDPQAGQQPMWNADGTACLVFNGEIYNFVELRRELEAHGHRFRTRSDTEVVVAAYTHWGPDCLERLNGMFALAVWDVGTQTLFLARDRVGEKPLYYYRDDDRLLFASEIKAILAADGVPRRLHMRGFGNFLAFGHAVAPDTIYENVRKLLPGHYLVARDGRVRLVRYWDVAVDARPLESPASTREHARRIRALLDDSVRRRMVADVPLGAFLSGGVDSAAVVALMARHAAGRVKTFSVGFEAGRRYNELSDARRVARDLGTHHHELEITPADLVPVVRTLAYHFDEPFADPAAVPLFMLSRFAREHVTVALTGDGGDELFGGYRRYVVDQLAPHYQRLPHVLTRSWVPSLADALPRLRRLKRAASTLPLPDPARRYAAWLRVFTPELQHDVLLPQARERLHGHDPAAAYTRHYRNARAADHLNRLMYVDVKTWLPDTYMEKTDKATMACSLEARMPLLDHRLVSLAFEIPARHKVRAVSTKRVLKLGLNGLVPPAVLRRRKHGFTVPVDEWLRRDLRPFATEILLDGRARGRGYFNATVVERLLTEHATGRHAWHDCLWTLLNLELWHRIYVDEAGI